jgi:hypothetical protein
MRFLSNEKAGERSQLERCAAILSCGWRKMKADVVRFFSDGD